MTDRWAAQYEDGVPRHLDYPPLVVPDLLLRSAEKFPTRPALHFFGRTITYRALMGLADRYAAGMARLGVRRGDVIGLMLPNLPQTVIGFYGGLRAGAKITAINPLYVESEIEQQLADAGCETVLVLDQLFPRIEPLLRRGRIKHAIVTGVQEFLPWLKRWLYPIAQRKERHKVVVPYGRSVHRLGEILAPARSWMPPAIAQDDVALLQYTGGTTGVPKGVILTHRNLVSNVWQTRHWMPSLEEGRERFLAVLPFFHVYGLSACQNLAIGIGASLTLLPRFAVGEVLNAIMKDRITVFPGIPAMYAAINQHQRVEQYNLHSVRLCISGAGPLHPSVQERFELLTGAKLVEGYGLTEAGPVTHVNPIRPPDGRRRTRSIGLPLPDTDAKIMDTDTGQHELPIGEIGELAVRGPQIMRGYHNRDADTKQVLRDGWLYTGDVARMDADGFFYIEDRKKDMIKSGGENVYPREVEEVLYRHPAVKEAVVAGIPLGMRGELIKAYVVLKDGAEATAPELLEHCRQQLAKFKVPRKIEFRRELPKTLVGKVLRRILVEEELKKGDLN